ncbi:S66 peptidase family protein [Maribacter sp. X9]|uniref:S66 peptidase family protein n=1 Tax=Maribacter sp. X9 TaxID=3402159 RepID=UPI003AF3A9B7
MASRRKFFSSVASISLSSLIPMQMYANTASKFSPPTRKFPKALKNGDTIGLIAPGYAFPKDVLEETENTLKALGFKTYHTDRVLERHGYFSNTDDKRAADINHMFQNSNVDAILCIRGGYGCTRIMEQLDYGAIAKNPKALIGFSDVTALLNGIFKMTGLVTFHGPVGSTLDDDYSIKSLQKVLSPATDDITIENTELEAKYQSNPEYERYTITPGIATGRICGGSLTLINALIGTPQEIDFTDALVFIEDVEEAPYRIDRMLTQLIESKTFKNSAGIIFGVCAGCNESTNPDSFSLKEVILDRIRPLNIPSVYGMSFGHVKQNLTFPIGVHATFKTEGQTITLLEKPVS